MPKRLRPSDWTWREVAAWIDTEGYLSPRAIRIPQMDVAPLLSLHRFLATKSIKSRLYTESGRPYVHVLSIDSFRHIRRLTEITKRFLRTEKKREAADAIVRATLLPRGRPPRIYFPFDPNRKAYTWEEHIP